MIMLLCNKQNDDSAAEDSKTIIQAMAIKKYFAGTFSGTINNLYCTTRTIALDQNSIKQNEDNNHLNSSGESDNNNDKKKMVQIIQII